MNSLTIPPSPNWYETSILACSLDNTVIYGSKNDLVIIKKTNIDVPNQVKIIPRAHSEKIVSVGVNKNWGQPCKFAVTASEDKIVKVWNINTMRKYSSHSKHVSQISSNVTSLKNVDFQLNHGRIIGATFSGDEKVISVSEDGVIVVWNLSVNVTTVLQDLLGVRSNVTCISSCPHASWLLAVGLKNGLVIIVDVRRNGRVLYKLRGHEKMVLSLSWCPVPFNIFPKNPMNNIAYMDKKELPKTELHKAEVEKQKLEDSSTTSINYEEASSSDQLQSSNLPGAADNSASTEDLEGSSEVASRTTEITLVTLSSRDVSAELEEATGDGSLLNLTKEEADGDERQAAMADPEEHTAGGPDDCLVCSTPKKATTVPTITVDPVTSSGEMDKKVESHMVVSPEGIDPQNPNIQEEVFRYESTESHGREEEQIRREFLLASSAKEGNVYIWRAGTDGRMQTFFKLPNKTSNRRFNKVKSDKIWITLCWIAPTLLLSSSKWGELLQWNLPKSMDKSRHMSIIHNEHSPRLFCIAGPMETYDESNWLDCQGLNAWTVGQERMLLNTELSTNKTRLACYPTLAGTVPCMELSPLDPNRLAMGTGDGIVRIWDLSRPHIKNITMTSFHQKIQSKVTALAWHPKKEMTLAFGTVEGRIGYLDTGSKSKIPTILPHFFNAHIYKMEWAPVSKKNEFGLYAIADGSIALYDITKSEEGPLEVDKPDNVFIYSFSWKKDYSMMVAATKFGVVLVYSPDLKILSKHYCQERVCEIVWHPNATQPYLKQANWFASITNSKKVIVYRFDIENEKEVIQIVAKYEGFGDLINSICWSPYHGNQVLIAGDSGAAQIWDVERNVILSTFTNSVFEGITSAIFSPADQDYAICSAKNSTVEIYKISEYPRKDPKEFSREKQIVLRAFEPVSGSSASAELYEEMHKEKKITKSVILPIFNTSRSSSHVVSDIRRLMKWKENPESVEPSAEDRRHPDILDVFGASKADMFKVISMNENIHKSKGKFFNNTVLSLFKGDISTSIKEAIEEKRVTPYILSLAPMVSPKLWQTACETLANQLLEDTEPNYLEICTYFLACHKVDKAINCLCDAFMFREALALAKCRLTENDEIITEIIEKWAKNAMHTGNYECAAQCYIYLGKYEDAASVLFRRSDLDIIELAVELAEKSDNEELLKAVLMRYESFKNMRRDEREAALPTRSELYLQKQRESAMAGSSGSSKKPKEKRKAASGKTDERAVTETEDSREAVTETESSKNAETKENNSKTAVSVKDNSEDVAKVVTETDDSIKAVTEAETSKDAETNAESSKGVVTKTDSSDGVTEVNNSEGTVEKAEDSKVAETNTDNFEGAAPKKEKSDSTNTNTENLDDANTKTDPSNSTVEGVPEEQLASGDCCTKTSAEEPPSSEGA
ncbi:gem-associated protein 5 isoform X2 [Leptinotarsa decemlineata]|uniref:gem-associated protein 5 isoform X2 n=1 Tax=Leptinotarsa decemlineata TaxID=7539 RepID=UPI003D30CB11